MAREGAQASATPSWALFAREGADFVPTDRARGPWAYDTLHGSPVAALIAFCVEERLAELVKSDEGAVGDLRIARQTIDLFRPVPYGRLAVEVEPLRRGRRIAVLQTRLSCEGKLLTQATTLCLRAAAEFGSVGSNHGEAAPSAAFGGCAESSGPGREPLGVVSGDAGDAACRPAGWRGSAGGVD